MRQNARMQFSMIHRLRLLGVALFFLVTSVTARAAEPRPNILFLFSDDQRFDTIHALGNPGIETPNLDRLVAAGTTFTQAHCFGSHHGAVCMPSRAMLMTGKSLFRVDESMKAEATWPQSFGQAGYATFATGKWHNSIPGLARSFQQARAIFPSGMGDPLKLKVSDLVDGKLGPARPVARHSVETFADTAVEFLQGAPKDQPWLCYVAFNSQHDPRVTPADFPNRYAANPPPLPQNFLPLHPFQNGDLLERDERLAPWPRTEQEVRRHLADYYSCITFMDWQIGRILAALDASGQREKTIIVFSSDHGLAIGSHGLMGKQSLYEHSMRAPLIFSGPGIPKGEQRQALCYLFDIYPTLGDLTGVAGPAGNEGLSLVPVMTGKKTTVRDGLFTAYKKEQRAWRDDRWKLIRYPFIDKTQLFDLQVDPFEMHDLSTAPEQADRVKELLGKLAKAQTDYADKQPLTVEKPEPAEWTPPKKGVPEKGAQEKAKAGR
jgi:arylsulfatase A-like enzyme